MTQVEFHDLGNLGRKIQEYCRAIENFRAVKEGRIMLAKGLRVEYPNMPIENIRNSLWKQEEDFAKTAQLAFEEMRMNAYSLGWNLGHKDARNELAGILRKTYPSLKDINV